MAGLDLLTRLRGHFHSFLQRFAGLSNAWRIGLVLLALAAIIGVLYLGYRHVQTWTRPTRRKLRLAVSRLTRTNNTRTALTAASVAGSGPSANATKADDIVQTMREFNDVAHDTSVVFLERAQAMVWLSQLYRVGWGPYRRNTAMAQRWAQAAGVRFRPESDLDLMDADDRPHDLPVYDPPAQALRAPSRSSAERSSTTPQADLRAMQALQRVVNETEQQVLHHQNVHNSGVTSGVHDTLTRFVRLHPHAQSDQTVHKNVNEIRSLIHSTIPEGERKQDALRVLDRMETSTTPLIRSGLTEAQILSVLWERRRDLQMDDFQSVELLADRLADSVENGNIVCTTGRVTHAVDMWSGVDDTVKLQTKEQEKQERLRRVQELSSQSVQLMHPNDQRRWNEGENIDDLRKRVTDHVLSQMPMQSEGHAEEIRGWIASL